mgnify:CR=1 FL=1
MIFAIGIALLIGMTAFKRKKYEEWDRQGKFRPTLHHTKPNMKTYIIMKTTELRCFIKMNERIHAILSNYIVFHYTQIPTKFLTDFKSQTKEIVRVPKFKKRKHT